ncbi:MAG: hypothetical protein RL095_3215 [Verrucomicrobiota bacterium]|jgi:uncharacterized membrane protein YjfL (UPF0719 family)
MKSKKVLFLVSLFALALCAAAQQPDLGAKAADLTAKGNEALANAGAANKESNGIFAAAAGLLVSVIQVCVGLAIASFSIITGFKILGKLLAKDGKDFDVWPALKNGNNAVALLAAGIVIAYTNVVSTGIKSMSDICGSVLKNLDSADAWKDGVSGFLGAGINLIIALAVASFAITVVFKIMDKLTKDIDENAEFAKGNTAIGILYAGIIIGVSQLVSGAVTGIGKGIGNFFSAILNSFS